MDVAASLRWCCFCTDDEVTMFLSGGVIFSASQATWFLREAVFSGDVPASAVFSDDRAGDLVEFQAGALSCSCVRGCCRWGGIFFLRIK